MAFDYSNESSLHVITGLKASVGNLHVLSSNELTVVEQQLKDVAIKLKNVKTSMKERELDFKQFHVKHNLIMTSNNSTRIRSHIDVIDSELFSLQERIVSMSEQIMEAQLLVTELADGGGDKQYNVIGKAAPEMTMGEALLEAQRGPQRESSSPLLSLDEQQQQPKQPLIDVEPEIQKAAKSRLSGLRLMEEDIKTQYTQLTAERFTLISKESLLNDTLTSTHSSSRVEGERYLRDNDRDERGYDSILSLANSIRKDKGRVMSIISQTSLRLEELDQCLKNMKKTQSYLNLIPKSCSNLEVDDRLRAVRYNLGKVSSELNVKYRNQEIEGRDHSGHGGNGRRSYHSRNVLKS
jgi:hypothetical protein